MTKWKDPYPNEVGCAWAKQRRKEMEDLRKEKDLEAARAWCEAGYISVAEYIEMVEKEKKNV